MRRDNRPFGGIQIVLQFDLMQLTPFHTPEEPGEDEASLSVLPLYECQLWTTFLEIGVFLELTEQQRFGKDNVLLDIINALRSGAQLPLRSSAATPELSRLHKALLDRQEPLPQGMPTPVYLSARRAQVQSRNEGKKKALPASNASATFPVYLLRHTSFGRHSRTCLVDMAESSHGRTQFERCHSAPLELTVGLRVMCTQRIPPHLVNGSLGMVIDFKENPNVSSPWPVLPVVHWHHGQADEFTATVPPAVELCEEGTMFWIPLLMAEALTIHKSVGATLPSCIIDCTGGM